MTWKDALFKEEPPKPVPPSAPRTDTSTVKVNPASWAMTPLRPNVLDFGAGGVVTSSNVYLILAKSTDFWATDEGKVVQKYLDTLSGVIVDEDQRLKAALALASKEGVTATQITATFSRLESALNDSKNKFASQAADWNKQEVEGRQVQSSAIRDKIGAFQKQIEDLQMQQSSISQDMTAAMKKSEEKKAEFDATFQVRAQELDALKQKFTK